MNIYIIYTFFNHPMIMFGNIKENNCKEIQ